MWTTSNQSLSWYWRRQQNLNQRQLILYLEAELREKPTVFSSLESLLKPCFGLLASSNLLVTWLKRINRYNVLQIYVEGVPRRHDVVVVNELDECLHTRLLRCLLCWILANHLLWVLCDSGDEAVAVRSVTSAVVKLPNDDRLPAGKASIEDNDGLIGLQKLHHLRFLSMSSAAAAHTKVCTKLLLGFRKLDWPFLFIMYLLIKSRNCH